MTGEILRLRLFYWVKEMELLWWCISAEARLGLARLYKKLSGQDFSPPREDARPFTVAGKIENLEEIGRLIRQPTRMRRPFK